jgi:hypothetical protein
MALADPILNIPSGTRPLTFESDSETYHNVSQPAKIQEIAAAALAMSYNSVSATSTTSMLIGTGAKTLTIQTAKSFLAGMDIRVVDVAAPNTNYVNASVTSYVSGTGVLQFTVPSGQAFGAGTLSNWSVFQVPAGGATNTFVQQLVQNQSANYMLAAGTATAVTASPSPAYGAVVAGQAINLTMPSAATGVAMTLQVNAQAALPIKTNDGLDPAWPAGFKGILELNTAATQWIVKNSPTNTKQIQPVTCTQAAGALTFGLNASSLDFRSITLTTGVPTTVNNAALSLVLPSGGTLGFATTVAGRMAIIAINTAGTMELAVIALAGGVNLDETGLINTTAISAASTANNVFYSTTARTGVAYRVVGTVDAINTAGTWATPTLVQGAGGQSLSALVGLGNGQAWQDLTGSRAMNITYTNSTGRAIDVTGYLTCTTANNFQVLLNGNIMTFQSAVLSGVAGFHIVVPHGQNYLINPGGANFNLTKWWELR